MATSRIDELISQYHDLLGRGQRVEASELTRDCPELLPELQRRLEMIAGTPAPQGTLGDAPRTLSHPGTPERPTASPPGYELIEELGRGGMGVVYRARQVGLNREVALKMILTGHRAGPDERARFRTEAEAAARLRHPNIVQVHEIGEHDGQPYLVMELCERGGLAARLGESPLPPREAAALIRSLAGAVQAAHDASVLHRDLKPGNVLYLADRTPRITDFGLARKMDEQGQTLSGAVIGTPSYMSPEQASGGKEVGPATDIYALGAILYECLTGRPPFKAATTFDTLAQVCGEEPVPPRRLSPKLPRDLETICLKCLHKEPARRYASAADLAADLGCFLAGDPIQARPVGTAERAWKWARRRPAVAALLALIAFLTAGSLTLISALYGNALVQADSAKKERDRAQTAEERTKELLQQAEERLKTARYAAQLSRAHRAIRERKPAMAFSLLRQVPEDQRGWEHGHLWLHLAALRGLDRPTVGGRPTECVAWSRDGRLLAVGGPGSTLHLWRMPEARQAWSEELTNRTIWSIDLSPDGRRLCCVARIESGGPRRLDREAGEVEVSTWDTRTGERLTRRLFADTARAVMTARYDPDGGGLFLALGREVARFTDDGKRTASVDLSGVCSCLVAHPTRDLLACGCADGVVLFDRSTLRPVHHLRMDGKPDVNSLAFSPDGSRLAAADTATGKVTVWETDTGRQVASFAVTDEPGRLTAVAFSPDGGVLVSGDRLEGACFHDPASGMERRRVLAPVHGGEALAFSPDGQTLACGTMTGVEVVPVDDNAGRPRELRPVTWSQNLTGDALITPRGVRIDLSQLQPREEGAYRDRSIGIEIVRGRFTSGTGGPAVSPDGRLEAVIDDRDVTIRDAGSKALRGILAGHNFPVRQVRFLPDGRLVSVSQSELKVWAAAQSVELYSWSLDEAADAEIGHDDDLGCLLLRTESVVTSYFSRALSVGNLPNDAARDRLGLLRLYGSGGRAADMIPVHAELRGRHPNNQPLRRWRLKALMAAARWKDAVADLRAGSQLSPTDGPLSWWLWEWPLLSHEDEPAVSTRAIVQSKKSEKVDEDAISPVYGPEMIERPPVAGEVPGPVVSQELLDELDAAILREPGAWPLLAVRGWFRLKLQQHKEATTDLLAAARAAGKRADLWAMAAVAASRVPNEAETRSAYDAVHRLAPAAFKGWHDQAVAVALEGSDVEPALALLGAYLALKPSDRAHALTLRGGALAKLGRHTEAAADLGQAVRLSPGDWVAQMGLAQAAFSSRDLATYRVACRELTRRFPTDARQAAAIARVCVLGPDATPDLTRVIRFAEFALPPVPPTLPVPRISRRGGDLDAEAIDQVDLEHEELDLGPGRIMSREEGAILLAAVLIRAGRHADAVRLLLGLKRSTNSAHRNSLLLHAYRRMNKSDEARKLEAQLLGAHGLAVLAGQVGLSGGLSGPLHGLSHAIGLERDRRGMGLPWEDWRGLFGTWEWHELRLPRPLVPRGQILITTR